LVFEGAPVLEPPLLQDLASRQAEVTDGAPLDTRKACLALTVVEKARLEELRAKDAHRLAPDRARAREYFVAEQAKWIVAYIGCTASTARRTVQKQCDGILTSGVVLPFDDEEMDGCTVADVLADPERFVGATLADPLEGVDYGRCKAKIMRRGGGEVWINSFAHGRTVYELRHDASMALLELKKLGPGDVPAGFVQLVLEAGLDEAESEELRNSAHEMSGIGKRALDAKLKRTRKEYEARQAEASCKQRVAERRDHRPHIEAPFMDDARVPVVATIDEVLCNQPRQLEPPIRDTEGRPTDGRRHAPVMLHEMLTTESNPGEPDEADPPACADDAVADAA
jgi:hypothetical protein